MASRSATSLTTYHLLILLACLLSSLRAGSPRPTRHIDQVQLDSLQPASTCTLLDDFKIGEGNSSVLRLVSRSGPCSPFASAAGSHPPNATEQLLQDEVRVKWLQSMASGELQQEAAGLPAYSGNQLGTLNFLVQIGLGSSGQKFFVVFDTGSDLTWVQCDPCLISCHQQVGPRFSPAQSSTFQYASCGSPDCVELMAENFNDGCLSSRCIYKVSYADGSATTGYFGRDTLALSPTEVFPNFRFGCGYSNTGLFGKEAGLLGLGRRKLSVVSQAAGRYGGVFSYCLPTGSATGFLTFGPDSRSNFAAYTPLLTSAQHPSFYFASLVGITVGGRLLPVPASVFAVSGTILDSGTIITRLYSVAYVALRDAFRMGMMKYSLTQPVSILDTCYDFSGYTTVEVPQIALLFEGGAKLVPRADGVLFPAGGKVFCLAFASSSGTTIVGNWQQRTTQVVHDLAGSRIGFRPAACP